MLVLVRFIGVLRLIINRWGKKQDHGEVRAQFHMKTRVFNSSKSFFDVSKLRDPACKDLYSSNLSANLASVPFTGVDEDHNGKWLRLKKAIVDVATESIRYYSTVQYYST